MVNAFNPDAEFQASKPGEVMLGLFQFFVPLSQAQPIKRGSCDMADLLIA
jgi:hypothetical protein